MYVLGLDIGSARIGLAVASTVARLPHPIETIPNDEQLHSTLQAIVQREQISQLVSGLPRNLQGQETEQTRIVQMAAQNIAKTLGLPLVFADESLSSVRADEYLKTARRPKPAQDSVAACFILEEYFHTIEG